MSTIPINREEHAVSIVKKYLNLHLSSNDVLSEKIAQLNDRINQLDASVASSLDQRAVLNEKKILEKEIAIATGVLTRRKILLPKQLKSQIKESFPFLSEEQVKQAAYIISKTVAQHSLEDWEEIPSNREFRFSLEDRFTPFNTFFIRKVSNAEIEVCIGELLGQGLNKFAYNSQIFNVSLLRSKGRIYDKKNETFFLFKCSRGEVENGSLIQKELIEKGVQNVAEPIFFIDDKHGRRKYYLGSFRSALKNGIVDIDEKKRNLRFNEILQIMEDVSLAIVQIHNNEYIHFDVKSGNFELYFDEGNNLRGVLDDFDIIRPFGEIGEYDYRGTYFYQSKQCLYDHKVSPQSDVAGLIISFGEGIYNKFETLFFNINKEVSSERCIFYHKYSLNKFLILYRCMFTYCDMFTEDDNYEFEEIWRTYDTESLIKFIERVYSDHCDQKEYKLMIAEINAVYSANELFYEMYKRDFHRDDISSREFYDRLKALNDRYKLDIKKAENNEVIEFRTLI